ncbi:hypothetical protein [Pedobacter sp.]
MKYLLYDDTALDWTLLLLSAVKQIIYLTDTSKIVKITHKT